MPTNRTSPKAAPFSNRPPLLQMLDQPTTWASRDPLTTQQLVPLACSIDSGPTLEKSHGFGSTHKCKNPIRLYGLTFLYRTIIGTARRAPFNPSDQFQKANSQPNAQPLIVCHSFSFYKLSHLSLPNSHSSFESIDSTKIVAIAKTLQAEENETHFVFWSSNPYSLYNLARRTAWREEHNTPTENFGISL
ncbi:hypothetical protein CC78DRAFT_223048 [Lojkania enalia]|uniref:Uncharacterized protein n=1 Tax=Lojkania enalia TaxID=147567 RepID=A0A9P4KA97_9PLEO|nr:hypothetical protein CC78DRAFT_223048 [Didymosphaeria enalia]